MHPGRVIPLLITLFWVTVAHGQSDTTATKTDSLRFYTTAMISSEPPVIDGFGNDPVWEQVEWGGGGFRQRDPDAGKPASVQTYFKILYDAHNIYFLINNLDPEPDKIVRRMSRRDSFDGDWVEINIDSYFDKRSAFSFTCSVSGVKSDEICSNNGDNWDASWDPIWYLSTSINAEGWIAEVRIPLSQLRFTDKPEHTWGLEVNRRFFRNQERSLWQYISPTANGWVHRFGELRGIKGIRPQKQLEVMPYLVTRAETFQKEDGNPFRTGESYDLAAGVDAKIGITSDITLDLTINPDFGQVEADPSQVNLTAFELFFREQRPFFIEGANILTFPTTSFGPDNLFYSRRIGRSPQGQTVLGPNEYSKQDSRTTILGAAKLTGKNHNGFSWGVLESVTQKEEATIQGAGETSKQTVEPLTNYFVARAQQDINKGNTIVGGMITATNRRIQDPGLNWLHTDAYSGGFDLLHHWRDRKYYVSAQGFASYVRGSPGAITTTQLSSERYFQRPDNAYSELDTTRKSLLGTGGNVTIGKRSGKLTWEIGSGWLSPQLELNDIGFLRQTDQIRQWGRMEYRVVNPVWITRSQYYNAFQSQRWDFDGRAIFRDYEANMFLEFKNMWEFGNGVGLTEFAGSNADLRGGPFIRYPGSVSYWAFLGTDGRKKLQMGINPFFMWGFDNYTTQANIDLDVTLRPTNALRITLSPGWYVNNSQLQYVETGNVNGVPRYVMGSIDQSTLRMSIRLTYMVTPNLSIQYWGQPFGTAGQYTEFKNITDGSNANYENRFTPIPPASMTLNGDMYDVDEGGNGTVDYSFTKPDFNFGQFKSNMVLRWEYIPGSVLFLVWTQEMDGAFYTPRDAGHSGYGFDFNQQAHNIFVMKFTYRFVL